MYQLKEGALIFVTGDERIPMLNQKITRNTYRDRNKGQELESLQSDIMQMSSLKEHIVNRQIGKVNVWGEKRGFQAAHRFSLCSSTGEIIQAQVSVKEHKRMKFNVSLMNL